MGSGVLVFLTLQCLPGWYAYSSVGSSASALRPTHLLAYELHTTVPSNKHQAPSNKHLLQGEYNAPVLQTLTTLTTFDDRRVHQSPHDLRPSRRRIDPACRHCA